MKYHNKGFTLAELLIVVAIIGALVAVSVPIFSKQLEKAREAADAANIRSQYAEVLSEVLTSEEDVDGKTLYGAIKLQQKKDEWQNTGTKSNLEGLFGNVVGEYPKAGGTAWVEYSYAGETAILHYEGGSTSSGDTDSGGSASSGDTGSSGSTSGDDTDSSGSTSGGDAGSSGSSDGDTSGSGESGSGTISGLPSSIDATDWEQAIAGKSSYHIVAGNVYTYEGAVYIAGKDYDLNEWDIKNVTMSELVNWYVMDKYTGKIWQESDFTNQRYDVNRGDLCQIDADYYVFKDGGTTTGGPKQNPGQWQKVNQK